MSEVVKIGTLKCGDWFVTPEGQRGMYLGQAVFCSDFVSVWVDTGQRGVWACQDWYAKTKVTPLPDCTGPDWVAPEPQPEIAVDTPVWVRDDVSHSWRKRHFAKWGPDGLIMTYGGGLTSHTSLKESPFLLTWKYYSLTDPNKDPEDE